MKPERKLGSVKLYQNIKNCNLCRVSTYDLGGVAGLCRGLGSGQSDEDIVRANQGDQVAGSGIQRAPSEA